MTTPQIDNLTDDYLRSLKFRSGNGTGKEGDRCSIQEYRAWLGLDPASYEIPRGDSKVIGEYIIGFQDRLINAGASQEQVYEHVTRHLPKLRGTGRGRALEQRRSYVLSDVMVRELAPLWLELHPDLVEHAKTLRGLAEITDAGSYEKAIAARDAARTAAWNVRRKLFDGLEARVRTTLSAKLEELRDPILKKAVAVAAAAAAVAVAVAAAAAAVAAEAAAEAAVAVAVAAAAAAEAAAVAEAAAAAEAAADLKRRPGETDNEFYWRARNVFSSAFYGKSYWTWRAKVREEMLAKHRATCEASWALGGKAIERMLAIGEAA